MSRPLYWPGLAEARGSLRHALALKPASGEPAGRVLYHLGFCHRHQRGPPQPARSRVGRWARLHTVAPTVCTARPAQAYRRLSVAGTGQALLPNPAVARVARLSRPTRCPREPCVLGAKRLASSRRLATLHSVSTLVCTTGFEHAKLLRKSPYHIGLLSKHPLRVLARDTGSLFAHGLLCPAPVSTC